MTELTERGRVIAEQLARIENPKKIVGFDLSLRASGLAVVYGSGETITEVLKTKADPDSPREGKALYALSERVLGYVRGGSIRADLVLVERGFATKNAGSRILLAHAAMDLAMAAAKLDMPVIEVAPLTLKVFLCGTSKVKGKEPTTRAVQERYGYTGRDDNEADAIGLAQMGWALLGRPLVELPVSHMRALGAVRNPGVAKAKQSAARAKKKAAQNGTES